MLENKTDGLIAIDLPAGTHKLLLTIKHLEWEIVGLVVSASAFLVAVWLVLRERWFGGWARKS